MSKPSVSIIVPVYKSEKTLTKCVDSIIRQTYTDWELILVDDGSPDASGKICDYFASSDSRIKVIHKKNGGVSSARNAGLCEATGKHVAFIDSDDYVDGEYLEKMIKMEASDLVICGFRSDDGFSFSPQPKTFNLSEDSESVNKLIKTPYYLDAPWCKLFKKDIIVKNAIRFDERMKLCEDTHFSYQYISKCRTISILPYELYHYVGIWGGGDKYELDYNELKYISKKILSSLMTIGNKYNLSPGAICAYHRGFHLSKLKNLFSDYSDVDIHRLYTDIYNYTPLNKFLADDRVSPLKIGMIKADRLAKNGNHSECVNHLRLLKKFITQDTSEIRFNSKKQTLFFKLLRISGPSFCACLLRIKNLF